MYYRLINIFRLITDELKNYGFHMKRVASQVALMVKNLPAIAGDSGDMSLIIGSGRFLGEWNGNPFQYSCLENPMDRGAWRAIVHGVAESDMTAWEWNYMEKSPILLIIREV